MVKLEYRLFTNACIGFGSDSQKLDPMKKVVRFKRFRQEVIIKEEEVSNPRKMNQVD